LNCAGAAEAKTALDLRLKSIISLSFQMDKMTRRVREREGKFRCHFKVVQRDILMDPLLEKEERSLRGRCLEEANASI